MSQLGFFDISDCYEILSKLGDPLESLEKEIDWRVFRPALKKVEKSKSLSFLGRPRYSSLLMFKVVLLQSLYNLSDEALEYQIRDRLSFRRFLGLGMNDKVPDARTIWVFKERLEKHRLTEKLFLMFHKVLLKTGFEAKKGQIVDASIIKVPRAHKKDSDEDKGESASWTKKGSKSYYGFKDHVSVDVKNKLIRRYEVTPAHIHDSQVFEPLIDENNTGREVYADKAYCSSSIEAYLKEKKLCSRICKKGRRQRPLSGFQEQVNRTKAKVRARVEHIFGFMKTTMKGLHVRTQSLKRAKVLIGLQNLAYNLCRFVYLNKHKIKRTRKLAPVL